MTADAFALEWLARAAAGGLVFLLAAAVAVRVCRQPADRVRVTSAALLGAVLVPWLALVPGLPRLSVAVLPAPAADQGVAAPRSPEPDDEVAPARPSSPAVAPVVVAKDAAVAAVPVAVAEPGADATRSHATVAGAAASPEPPADTGRSPGSGWSVGTLLVGGYAAATLALVAWAGLGFWRLGRLRRAARPAPPAAVALLREIAGPAADRVELLVSDRIESPVAFPGLRPAIVLPAADTDPAAVRFALAHEWSHVERGDLRRWCLTTFAQAVLFYQPLFWWLRRQLRLSQDYLADARAAAAGDPADYAAYLVALARRRCAAPALALGVADRRSHLTRRVHMLLLSPEPPRPRCRPVWTAGVALVAVGLLAGLSAVRLTAADAPKPDAKDEAKPAAAKPADPDAPKPETLNYFGVVTDKDTKTPIAGATVVVRRSLSSEDNRVMEESKHTTDATGKYTFVIPPEQTARRDLYIELDVEHPEYAPRKGFGYALGMIVKNEKLGNRPFFEAVELRPGQPVTGVVHTPDGKPAAGVKVMAYSVTSKRKPGEFEYGSFADTRTDRDGKYRLTLTTPGWAVVWFLPEQYVPTTRVVNDKRGDLGTYTMRDGPRLTGKLLDAKGKPLAGVAVHADLQDRNDEITEPVADNIGRVGVTNEKGEFAMAPLPPGNYLVKPQEHAWDATKDRNDRKTMPVPAVFLGTKVVLKADAKPEPVEVRAVPHVVIEGQYYDSKGKPCRGFGPHVAGELDGIPWFAEAKCKDGKFVCNVPHGLQDVSLGLVSNEHGSLRWRKKAGEPLNNTSQVQLGTLTDDVTGFEVVAYTAPILLVTVKAPDGVKAENVSVTAVYGAGKAMQEGVRLFSAKGRRSDVSFEGLAGGKYQSSQLFPDEEVTVVAYADGYESKPATLKLAEGTTKEIELTLEPAKDEPKKAEKKE